MADEHGGTMKTAVKQLWQLCFDDSSRYVDFYFKHFYSDKVNCAIEREGAPVAALQQLPFSMKWGRFTLPTAYLSGVCTHPDWRGQGLMKALLDKSFHALYDGGVAAATLIPATNALFQAYGRRGFASVFDYATQEFSISEQIINDGIRVVPYTPQHKTAAFALMQRDAMALDAALQISDTYFDTMVAAFALENRPILVAIRQEQVCGLLFGIETGQVLWLSATDRAVRTEMLNAFCRHYETTYAEVIVPANDEEAVPLGMLRVINVEQCLRVYAALHPTEKHCFNVFDDAIAANNGCFLLENGSCRRSTAISTDTITTAELSALLFFDTNPYMALMLNK